MATSSKKLWTGISTAAVFVLAIGGLVAFGAGAFDGDTEPASGGNASQAAPGDDACPYTGCADESGQPLGLMQTGLTDCSSEKAGCGPTMKGGSSAAAATSKDGCSGCSDCADACASAASGFGAKNDCGGSCDSMPEAADH